MQDTLLYILEHRDKFMSLDPVKPWMMRCLYHRFVDNYRRYNRYEPISEAHLESLKTQEDFTETAFFSAQNTNIHRSFEAGAANSCYFVRYRRLYNIRDLKDIRDSGEHREIAPCTRTQNHKRKNKSATFLIQ